VRVWSGAKPEGTERFDDGGEAIVGGSRVER